ncbi:uncharacterized protein [Chelonus insularis]|uniref:uncharacterized protein n=1 Tax=Chelonus insularis TaxID=460826 RepID=UPI00158BAB82|nr:uncharacterized protein LOC118072931 [Chelonus insularis]
MVNVIVSSSVQRITLDSTIMLFSQILFLSFAVSAWTAPHSAIKYSSSVNEGGPEPIPSDDITINDQTISVTKPLKPIAEVLDPYHRGIKVIHTIAKKNFYGLSKKLSQINSSPMRYQINPTKNLINSRVSAPFLLFQRRPLYVVPLSVVQGQLSSSSSVQSSNHPSDGNRLTQKTMKNLIQGFLSAITNQDNVKSTTVNPELSDELSESGENQSGSTMTTSTTEDLQTTTAIPTEFESTTTFETTSEIPTTKSKDEEMILSTIQPELLDQNAEIDEAVAFNIDGGNISSTQESATQSPKINKDNFYVIYGRPTLTKKDNSLLLNANIGVAVSLNGSNID